MKAMKKGKDIWDQAASNLAGENDKKSITPETEKDKNAMKDTEDVWKKTDLRKEDFTPDVEAGWKQFQLKVRMRSSKQPSPFSWVRVAATALLLLSASFLIYQYISSQNQRVLSKVEILAEKEVREVKLPDGSQVWLNQGAELSYNENFSANNREVELKGEAFFDIVKMDGKRFTVLTETSITEVLGTSFNVIAKPGRPAKVQVATGKVAVTPKKSRTKVILNPGEEVSISDTEEQEEQVITQPIEDQNYRAWQNKKLIFTNVSIPELALTLEQYFETSIQVDEALKSCRFTSSFDDPKLEEVLKVLELTGDFEIKETETGHRVTGKPCKE